MCVYLFSVTGVCSIFTTQYHTNTHTSYKLHNVVCGWGGGGGVQVVYTRACTHWGASAVLKIVWGGEREVGLGSGAWHSKVALYTVHVSLAWLLCLCLVSWP